MEEIIGILILAIIIIPIFIVAACVLISLIIGIIIECIGRFIDFIMDNFLD